MLKRSNTFEVIEKDDASIPLNATPEEETKGKTSEIIGVTKQLLNAIGSGDFEEFSALCDPNITGFDPSASNILIRGVEFYRFAFEVRTQAKRSTLLNPSVVMLGDDSACIAYVHLSQPANARSQAVYGGYSQQWMSTETRIWKKRDGRWMNVHFHLSGRTPVMRNYQNPNAMPSPTVYDM